MIRLVLALILLWPASALALEVSDNRFLENGETIVLRGIAMGDVLDLPADANPYPEIAGEWRANTVRLSVHPGNWRDRKDEALATLSRHVEQARAAGLYVIIDYHVIGFPDGYEQEFFDVTDPGTRTDHYDSRFTLAMDFWLTVALRFRDTAILYELWNEPVSGSEEEAGGDLAYWKEYRPYWRVLTDAIRTGGNANVILAAPPLYAFNARGLTQSLLPDENTAYTWHVYAGEPPEGWADALDDLDQERPVIVTEWGFEPGARQHWAGTAEEFGEPFTAFLDERGLSSTAWCWNPDYGPNLRRQNGKLTEWGQFAKAYLAKQALAQ